MTAQRLVGEAAEPEQRAARGRERATMTSSTSRPPPLPAPPPAPGCPHGGDPLPQAQACKHAQRFSRARDAPLTLCAILVVRRRACTRAPTAQPPSRATEASIASKGAERGYRACPMLGRSALGQCRACKCDRTPRHCRSAAAGSRQRCSEGLRRSPSLWRPSRPPPRSRPPRSCPR